MLYFLWGVVFIGTALYEIQVGKSNRYKKFVLTILFIYMWILLGWSKGAYDVDIGISRYINYENYQSYTEIGYTFLVMLGHRLEIGYRTFFVICSFVEIFFMVWFGDINSTNSPIVVGLFLFFLSGVYFLYIRNLAAIPFVLIAMDSLLNKRKKYIAKYIIFILIASTIHFSTLFFLLYLPISFCKKKKTVALATIIGCIVLQVGAAISTFNNFVSQYLGDTKTDILMRSTDASGNFGRIFAVVFCIMTFFGMYFLLKYVYKIKMNNDKDNLFFNINLLSFICIPLTLNYGVGFARIPTLLLLVNYTFLVSKISMIESQKKRLLMYCILGIFLLGLFILAFRNIEYRNLVLYPFFEQNELIEWLFN